MQFAAPGQQEHVGVVRFLDTQRHVHQQFLGQAIADLAAGDELAFLPAQRRGIHHQIHRQRRLVHLGHRQGFRFIHVSQRHTDADFINAVDQHDVARQRFIQQHAFDAAKPQHLVDARALRRFIAIQHHHILARLDAAATHAPNADAADEAGIIQRGYLQLQRRVHIGIRRGHILNHRIEQRTHIRAGFGQIERGIAVQCRCIHHRKIQLLFGRAEFVKQIKSLVDHPIRARAVAIHLIDHHDRAQAQRQCLLGNEAGLRHRAFHRIHQQQHTVHHAQHALHLAAEVGVAGCIDDIDMHALVIHRAVLCQNGNATLLFQIVAVHDALGDMLVGGKCAGLAEQLVHHGGFAVVDVGDNGDIADFAGHGNSLAM